MRSVLASVLFLAACSTLSPQTFIDGFPVGDRMEVDPQFVAFATESLDSAIPGHAEVGTVEMYAPDFRIKDGTRYIVARGGGQTLVVVFHLVDDTTKAFFVGCGVGIEPNVCLLVEPPSDL